MNTATGYFASSAAIALALQAQLQGVQMPGNGGPAFQRVELFDSENLPAAFNTLLISQQTVAVVVPLEARWEEDNLQRKLVTRRVQEILILITDRVIGNRTAALYGSDTNTGAYSLAALALPAVTGQLLPNPGGIISAPTSESTVMLKDGDRQNLPGRAVVSLALTCKGGWLQAALDPGLTL